MKKPGHLVCLVNKVGEPFLILRPTLTESYVFCLKDEIVSENNYDRSNRCC